MKQLSKQQGILYADDTRSVLMVLQAMDAAGKDGTIRHVMSGVNPQGCQVFSFKAPSAEERDHSYLWRSMKALPERGRIGIHNRSYYEEVLVCRVHPEILAASQLPEDLTDDGIWKRRFREINDFERHLVDNGMTVLKFFLHVSKEEQKRRFLARIDEEDKNWKFSVNDAKERTFWKDYMRAYEDVFTHTSTEAAPWYIVPADNKWFTRLAVAAITYQTLEDLKLAYPTVSAEQKTAAPGGSTDPELRKGLTVLTFSRKILVGLVSGLALGIFLGEAAAPLKIVADGFVKLLQMTVLPYVTVSIVSSLGGLSLNEARTLGRKLGAVLVGLWLIALLFAFLIPLAFPPIETASFFSTSLLTQPAAFNFVDLYIPSNPFHSLANNVVPAVVLFSVVLGVALIGIERKQILLDPLHVAGQALARANRYVVKLTPYGLFAIAASTAGTIDIEQVERLQVFLITYVAVAMLVALWVLPGLVAALTPIRYREVFRPFRDAFITAFIAADLFMVLPILIESCRELLERHQISDPHTASLPDVIVPASFNFPHTGKLLSLSFVLFAGWFADAAVTLPQYPQLAFTGFLTFFASLNAAIPFLLDLFRIPADTFQLFLAAGVINSRVGTLVAAVHTVAVALLGSAAIAGALRVQRRAVRPVRHGHRAAHGRDVGRAAPDVRHGARARVQGRGPGVRHDAAARPGAIDDRRHCSAHRRRRARAIGDRDDPGAWRAARGVRAHADAVCLRQRQRRPRGPRRRTRAPAGARPRGRRRVRQHPLGRGRRRADERRLRPDHRRPPGDASPHARGTLLGAVPRLDAVVRRQGPLAGTVRVVGVDRRHPRPARRRPAAALLHPRSARPRTAPGVLGTVAR